MAIFNQPFLSGGFPSMNRAAGAVGGWVELGRTTLGSAGTTVSVTSLADKRYYKILFSGLQTGNNVNPTIRYNNDSGSNYADRNSFSGGADSTSVSRTNSNPFNGGVLDTFAVQYLANLSTNEKLGIVHSMNQGGSGSGTAPARTENVHKWTNTSAAINRIDYINAANIATGSEVVVLGWDPDDTHTNNFWQELASVDLSGGAASQISSGTFTAKKYLWVQLYYEGQTGSSANVDITYNNDTGSNYSSRESYNGGADATRTSQTKGRVWVGYSDSIDAFHNRFIINNASNEKLAFGHTVLTTASGSSSAPERFEIVDKWDNTSNQITEIDIDASDGNFGTGTILKVWGAD